MGGKVFIYLLATLVLCSGDELAADQTVIIHEKKQEQTVPGPPGTVLSVTLSSDSLLVAIHGPCLLMQGQQDPACISTSGLKTTYSRTPKAPRNFHTLPPPISMPFTSEKWTVRKSPGISQYHDNPKGVVSSLIPLINYAKNQLIHVKDQWGTFPIFLKATAGMRELPLKERVAIMVAIQDYFADNNSCPFLFDSIEQARVISGEEEAAYAWAGVNFVSGALLESSWGTGTATPVNAFGTLEMGGASHQIAFFQPEQSILANLFKLQIGGSKHWNVYAHSHLQYGRVSSKDRMWSHLAKAAGCFEGANGTLKHCEFVDACLPQGVRVVPFDSISGHVQVHPPMEDHPLNSDVVINSIEAPVKDQWGACLKQIVEPLGFGGLEKETRNKWCNYTHLGQCSYAGVYQPSIPDRDSAYGQFILIGGYVHVHKMLKFNTSTFSLFQLRDRATEVCAMNYTELLESYGMEPESPDVVHSVGDVDVAKRATLEQLCFLSSYAFSILHHGHGFEVERNFTVMETMEYAGATLKVGWQLGAILYEINSLPWTYSPEDVLQSTPTSTLTVMAFNNTAFILLVCFIIGIALVVWRLKVNTELPPNSRIDIKIPNMSLPFSRKAQYQPIN